MVFRIDRWHCDFIIKVWFIQGYVLFTVRFRQVLMYFFFCIPMFVRIISVVMVEIKTSYPDKRLFQKRVMPTRLDI